MKELKETQINVSHPNESENYLAKLKPGDVTVATLKSKYSDAKAVALDRKGLDAAIKEVKAARLDIEKTRKGVVSDLEKFQRAVNAEAKRLIAEIVLIETPLVSEKERILAEIEAEKQKELREKLKQFNDRTEQLFEVGFIYDGQNYVAGTYYMSPTDIEGVTDEEFADALALGREKAEAMRRRLAELERLEDLERKAVEAATVVEKVVEPTPTFSVPTAPTFASVSNHPFADDNEPDAFFMPSQPIQASTTADSDSLSLYRPSGYSMGFDACRLAVLDLLENSGPMKKSELIVKIKEIAM